MQDEAPNGLCPAESLLLIGALHPIEIFTANGSTTDTMTHQPSAHPIIEQLASTVIGKYLSDDQIHKIVDVSQILEIHPGQFLFREGQNNPYVYVMLDGQIDLVMQVRSRGSQRILSLGAGDLVAWSAILGNGTMTCSALCIRHTRLVAIDARLVLDRMQSDHEFGYQFMRLLSMALAQRLTATRLQLLDLFAPASPQST